MGSLRICTDTGSHITITALMQKVVKQETACLKGNHLQMEVAAKMIQAYRGKTSIIETISRFLDMMITQDYNILSIKECATKS